MPVTCYKKDNRMTCYIHFIYPEYMAAYFALELKGSAYERVDTVPTARTSNCLISRIVKHMI